MSSRIRTVLAIVLAALVAVPAAAAAGGDRPDYKNPRLPVRERVADLLSRMTLEEKVGQMTQTERYQVFDDDTPITTWELGSILSGGGSTPTENTPEAWADMVDRFQRAALRHPAGHPSAVRDRRRARERQRTRRHGVPAQHRAGRDARPAARKGNRRDHGRGDPRHRAAVDVLPVHLRRPRRPLGPDVRELQRGPGPRDPHGDRDRRLPGRARGSGGPRPRARHREALRRRRRHRVRHRRRRLQDRPGHRDHQSQGLLGRVAAAVRARRARSPRGQRDAVVLERRLDRGRRWQPDQDAREPRADHRRAEAVDALQRPCDQRLGGHPPDPR